MDRIGSQFTHFSEYRIAPQLSMTGPHVGTATAPGTTLLVQGRVDEIGGKAVPTSHRSPQKLAAFLLRELQEGGPAFLRTAKGQFSLGVELQGTIYCWRSQFSLSPIYYHGDGASNRLLSFADDRTTLDPEYFARFLLQSRGLQWESPLTPLKGVSRLPPGYLVEIKDGEAKAECYQPLSETIYWDTKQEAAVAAWELDTLLSSIVGDSLDSFPGRVGCEPSGGLDSSYVNCLVADRRAQGHPAIMYGYAERASHLYSEDCAWAVADAKKIDLRIVRLPEMTLPDLSELTTYRDEPNPMHWQGELFGPLLAERFTGSSILFTGFGSDSLMLHQTEVLPYLLRTKKWREFFSTARGMGKTLERSPVNLMYQAMLCLSPVGWRKAFRNTFSRLKYNPFSVEDLVPLGPGSAVADWMTPAMKKYLDSQPVEFGKMDFSYLPYANAVMGPYLDQEGIAYIHPYVDSRFIHHVREKLSGHLIHDFDAPYKNLLRQAQKGRVPESVRNRTKNEFHFDGFHAKVLAKNIRFYRQLLQEPLPIGQELIDQKQISVALEQLQFGIGSPTTYLLTRLIAYLVWWRNFKLAS